MIIGIKSILVQSWRKILMLMVTDISVQCLHKTWITLLENKQITWALIIAPQIGEGGGWGVSCKAQIRKKEKKYILLLSIDTPGFEKLTMALKIYKKRRKDQSHFFQRH